MDIDDDIAAVTTTSVIVLCVPSSDLEVVLVAATQPYPDVEVLVEPGQEVAAGAELFRATFAH